MVRLYCMIVFNLLLYNGIFKSKSNPSWVRL